MSKTVTFYYNQHQILAPYPNYSILVSLQRNDFNRKKEKPTPDKEKVLAKIYGNGINITNYFIKNESDFPTTSSMDKQEKSPLSTKYMQYFNREKSFTTKVGKRPKSSSFVRKVPRGSLCSKNKDNPNASLQKEPSKDSDANELQRALQLRSQAHSTSPSLTASNKRGNMVRRKLSTKLGVNKEPESKPIIIINSIGCIIIISH
jgi:hypothetical protein